MKKRFCILCLVIMVSGCSTMETFIMGTDYTNHQKKTQEIEEAYKNGEITKAEYLQLKLDEDRNYSLKGIEQKVEKSKK